MIILLPNIKMKLSIKEISDSTFKVIISDEKETSHLVSVSDDFLNKFTKNKITKKKLIELSFNFLLEREKNSSILREFQLQEISKYFPEYFDSVRSWIK